jgi:hypothetical protein
MYKRVELKEGSPVQYVGVYVTRWQPEWGEPQVGFVESDYSLFDALLDLTGVQLIDNTIEDADIARREIKTILRKLAGEE